MQSAHEFITREPANLWAATGVCVMVIFYLGAWGWLGKEKATASHERLRTVRNCVTVGGLIIYTCFLLLCGWLYAEGEWQIKASASLAAWSGAFMMAFPLMGLWIVVRHLLEVFEEMRSASAARMLIAIPVVFVVIVLAAEGLALLGWFIEKSPSWMEPYFAPLIVTVISSALGALWLSGTHTALILRCLFLSGAGLIILSAVGIALWRVAYETSPLLVGLLFLAGAPIVLWRSSITRF